MKLICDNILLVRPPQIGKQKPYPPTSLATLQPYFEGWNVGLCDMQAGDSLEKSITRKAHSLIMFTAYSSQLKEVDQLIRFVKKNAVRNGAMPCVVGGSGVTANPQYAQSQLPNADILVVGDGELFAQNLTGFIEKYTLTDEPIICTEPYRWQNHNVPAWELTKYKQFLSYPGLPVETSRGCCMNCCFCTAHMINGKQWRPRTPQDVVKELSYLKQTYGCKLFYFPDDNATVNPKRWVDLMQQIVDANLDIRLHVPEGIQAHNLTYDTLALMKKAGFRNIFIGAESGSQRVLDEVIDKGGLTTQQTLQVVKDCRSLGITVSAFMVTGIVGETLAESQETVTFAQKLRELGAYSVNVRNAIPIPGTRMYEQAKANGFLKIPEGADLTNPHTLAHYLQTPEWTPKQITELVLQSQQQDAAHILKHHKSYIIKKGTAKLLHDPKGAIRRIRQLRKEANASTNFSA